MSQKHRALIYRILVVIGVGTVVFGWVTEEQLVTVLGLIGTTLGNITSTVYTPYEDN